MDRELHQTHTTIAEVIEAEGGIVTLARFMNLALTHPALGYYSRVNQLLWHGGDFSTAPAISPFFNRAVAKLATELVDAGLTQALDAKPSVVELGGGEGHLAGVILNYWKSERPDLRAKLSYRIVEIGGPLQEKQHAAVQQMADAGWDVGWGRDLEEASAGSRPILILANEFLDTIPVHLVGVRGGAVREAYVKTAGPSLTQTWGELSQPACAELELLFGTVEGNQLAPHTEDGVIELFPGLEDLMGQVAAVMPAGSFLNIDYGEWFPTATTRQESGLEGRALRRKTVRGYFKHQLVDDPLARAGRQDLTADVDFGAVDAHGRVCGFETVSFTTMAAFLRAAGAEDELAALESGTADAADALEADRQATVLRGLLDEYDLGGAFKFMLQVRE